MLSSLHRPSDPRIFQKEARTLAHAGYDVTYVALACRTRPPTGSAPPAVPSPGLRFARPTHLLDADVARGAESRGRHLSLSRPRAHSRRPGAEDARPSRGVRRARRPAQDDSVEALPSRCYAGRWPWRPGWSRRRPAGHSTWSSSRQGDRAVVPGPPADPPGAQLPDRGTVRGSAERERPERGLVAVYAGGLTAVRGVVEMVTAIDRVDPRHHPRLILCELLSGIVRGTG